jgi:hypothetical protein
MNVSKTLFVLFLGFAAGVFFVFSCAGDNRTPLADAATQCDCPASEPPLRSRIVRRSATQVIPAMGSSAAVAACDLDAIVLSGGCFANSTDSKYVLRSSNPGPDNAPFAWSCDFYNGTASPVTSTAYVTCLKPAP